VRSALSFNKMGLDVALMASKGVGWMGREQHRNEGRSTGETGGAQGRGPETTPAMATPNETPEPSLTGSPSAMRKYRDDLAMLKHFLDDVGPDRTPEEREHLEQMARVNGRPLTPQEERLHIAQARMIGDL